MSADVPVTGSRWAEAWPDALAFAGGLAVAGFSGWKTTDLIWSLWLASLVVGYATILWSIFGPGAFIAARAWRDRDMLRHEPKGPIALGGSLYVIGALFLLAFFTVHFGMFHFVHSAFLQLFFPVGPPARGNTIGPSMGVYLAVAKNYWIFLPAAFLAERRAFRFAAEEPAGPPDTAVTPEAIAARKARNAVAGGMTGIMAPYKNVVRLHLLIFFFAFAHFAKLENFFVYAVVYAAYFLPWRLRGKNEAAGSRQ